MNQTTSFGHYAVHFLVVALGFALPLFLLHFPAIANLTIGALLSTVFDYLKHLAGE